jgi:hypothetical protein
MHSLFLLELLSYTLEQLYGVSKSELEWKDCTKSMPRRVRIDLFTKILFPNKPDSRVQRGSIGSRMAAMGNHRGGIIRL